MVKWGRMGSKGVKRVKWGSKGVKQGQTGSKGFKRGQTKSNLVKRGQMDQMGPNEVKWDLIRSNQFKGGQKGYSKVK